MGLEIATLLGLNILIILIYGLLRYKKINFTSGEKNYLSSNFFLYFFYGPVIYLYQSDIIVPNIIVWVPICIILIFWVHTLLAAEIVIYKLYTNWKYIF